MSDSPPPDVDRVSGSVFRAIFEEGPVGIALMARDLRVMRANPEFCRITGYSEAELRAKRLPDVAHPGDADAESVLAERLMRGEIPRYRLETRYLRKDGETVRVKLSVSMLCDERGEPLSYLATIQDISEAKRADGAHRANGTHLFGSEDSYRQMLDTITDLVFVKDRESRLVWSNRALCEFYGMTREQIAGSLDSPMSPEEHTRQYVAADGVVLATGTPHTVEEEPVTRHDGSVRLFNTVKSPLRNAQGLVVGLVGVARDITDRRALEEQIARSTHYFQALIENALDAILIVDAEGVGRYLSPSVERMLGWTPAELIDRNLFDLVHPDDRPLVDEVFSSKGRRSESRDRAEFRVRHKGGNWRYVEAVGHNRIEDPAVGGVVLNVRDVSERHRAQEELARSETYYRALIENSLDIVTILDEWGAQLYVSPSAERVMGWTAADIKGRSAFDLVHPEDAPRVMALFGDSIVEPGSKASIEFRGRHKDGRWLQLEASGHNLLGDPAVRGVVVHTRDITQRRLAEERLAFSENYHRALIEQASDAITIIETDGTIRYMSPAIEKILGFAPVELEGSSLLELAHPDDVAKLSDSVANWPSAPEQDAGSSPARFRARHKDGSWRHLEGTGRICFDDPVIRGVLGSVRDVTERVAAEEEREQLIGELRSALAQVKTLSGLLPICSSCKRVRDDQGYWTQIEAFVRDRSQADFSHSICPRCAKTLYPEFYDENATDKVR